MNNKVKSLPSKHINRGIVKNVIHFQMSSSTLFFINLNYGIEPQHYALQQEL